MSFLSEIREQPQALMRLADKQIAEGGYLALKNFIAPIKPKRVLFSGMGSSFIASEFCSAYLQTQGLDALTIESGEVSDSNIEYFGGYDLLVAVSQSGKSKELVSLCERLKGKLPILAVTNDLSKPLAPLGNYVFEICSGVELFTASKSYTNTLGALLIIARVLLSQGDALAALYTDFRNCHNEMDSLISDEKTPKRLAAAIQDHMNYTMIGSGYSYCTAWDAVFVASEAAKVFTGAFTTGQFLHGPTEIICNRFAYFVFDTDCAHRSAARDCIRLILQNGGKVIHIHTQTDLLQDNNYCGVCLPALPCEMMPILEIILVELIVNEVGLRKGIVPGALQFVEK